MTPVRPIFLRPLVVRFEKRLPPGNFTLVEGGANARTSLYVNEETGEHIEIPNHRMIPPMVPSA
jgi:hypothetical protein